MPTVIVPSVSSRAHSWLFKKRRSFGTLLIALSGIIDSQRYCDRAVAHERRPHDARGQQPPADLDLAAIGRRGRNAREPDRALDGRRKRAARDLALADGEYDHFLVRPQDPAVLEQQADELAWRACCLLRDQRGSADEVALGLPRNGPREPRLERRRAFVHVVAVEIHAGLEPQRVARAETA